MTDREALIDFLLETPLIQGYDWVGTGTWPGEASIREDVGELADAVIGWFAGDWQYGIRTEGDEYVPTLLSEEGTREHLTLWPNGSIVRRRPAGAWEPVEASSSSEGRE